MPKSIAKTATAKAADTKAKIIVCAVQNFNAFGYESCTTHTIAEAAGLSPGNLYYHFKNKERIAEEIFFGISKCFRVLFQEVSSDRSSLGFPDFLQKFFDVLYQYRFFFRDFSLILRTDANLEKSWNREFNQSRELMKEAAQRWIKLKLMKPFDSDSSLEAFLDNCFTLIFFGLVYSDGLNPSQTQSGFQNHIKRVLEFLLPYHTTHGQKIIQAYRNQIETSFFKIPGQKNKSKVTRGSL